MEQTVRQAHAELLDEGRYIAAVRTFCRLLSELRETKERRNQRAARSNAIPRLTATRPNEVWAWGIEKQPTFISGTRRHLVSSTRNWEPEGKLPMCYPPAPNRKIPDTAKYPGFGRHWPGVTSGGKNCPPLSICVLP